MINYFKGGWTQKDFTQNKTMIWKNNILFQKPQEQNVTT